MGKKLISVITPTFNEGEALIACCEAVKEVFAIHLAEYELEHIICDNGSGPESVMIARNLPNAFPHVKVILNTRNFGVLPNAYNGALAASGDAILLFLPVDLQDPPSLLPQFVELWDSQGYDLVYGVRKTRIEAWWLRNARFFFYNLLSRFASFDYPANAGDFQLVDRSILDAVKEMKDARPFMRMATFLVGGKSIGIEYTWEKANRPSKNGLVRMIDQAFTGLTAYSTAPLRAAVWIGLTVFLLSFGYAIVSALGVLIFERSVPNGILSILIGVFVLGGLNLMFIGILGEYLLHVHENGRGRQVVYERERLNFD